MRRLVFSAFRGGKAEPLHPLEAGDLCMAQTSEGTYFLSTVVDFKKRRVVFFDDGSEIVVEVADVKEASRADRDAVHERYTQALQDAKKIAMLAAEDVIGEAIERVEMAMGGTLGDDCMISYTEAAGSESREGLLLCEQLIQRFGTLASEAGPALNWIRAHWREVCEEADADRSGTISEDEAALIWDRVSQSIFEFITKRLDMLGAPPRLYRGDLCLALPVEADADSADPSRLLLATYMDASHVTYFDGAAETVSPVRRIEPATPAAKENAILRYSKAVAQCKAAARKPSESVVQAAIEKVKLFMGGTLGRDNAIDYRADAGDEAREGQLLLQALVANFGALKQESKAVQQIEKNWKVACAQADEDESGTISFKEAVAIWDRLIIELTRTFTAKLDKLGVNPIPHVLAVGDLCMVNQKGEDAKRLHLATFVDTTHAVLFDDGTEEAVEVAKVGPASQADRDVAIVKYSMALNQCMRLLEFDAADLVGEALGEVQGELKGERALQKGADGEVAIHYRRDAGERAGEGQALCEALVSNLGALWDASPSVNYMMEHWQETCEEADTDNSGTISAQEAAEIWEKALQTFMRFVGGKLLKLGVAKATMLRKRSSQQSSTSTVGGGGDASGAPGASSSTSALAA